MPCEQVAAALSLGARDILTATHAPLIVSVGLPFLVVEFRSDTALARATPDLHAYQQLMPVGGADTIYACVRADDDRLRSITARAFSPLDGIGEDPATGSAAAATAALMCDLTEMSELELAVLQGREVGRSSWLKARAVRVHGEIHESVRVSALE